MTDFEKRKLSCPKCHQFETVRISGNTHYICDPLLKGPITASFPEGRPGCNAEFYIQGIIPENEFEDRYIHFPFNVIFNIASDDRTPRGNERGKYNFYRKPCIWTVYPNRIREPDVDCRAGCPDRCQRVHCPKNPEVVYCCDDYPQCDCEHRNIPGDMWQCVWNREQKCPDTSTIRTPSIIFSEALSGSPRG